MNLSPTGVQDDDLVGMDTMDALMAEQATVRAVGKRLDEIQLAGYKGAGELLEPNPRAYEFAAAQDQRIIQIWKFIAKHTNC